MRVVRGNIRRNDLFMLIREANRKASRRNRKIDTVDPLIACARKMYPSLPLRVISEYARTALWIIVNNNHRETSGSNNQTDLLTFCVAR